MSDLSDQPVSPDPARAEEGVSKPAPAPTPADLASMPPPPLPNIPAPAPTSQADRAVPQPSSRPGIRLPKPKQAASKPSISKSPIEPAAVSHSEIPSWLSNPTLDQLDSSPSALTPLSADVPRKLEPASVNPFAEELAAVEEAVIRARQAEIVPAGTVEAQLLAARQREAALLAEQMRAQPPEPIDAPEPKLTGLREVLFSLGLNNPNRPRSSGTVPELPQVPSRNPSPDSTQTTSPVVETETPAETARVVDVPPELPPPQADMPRRDRRDRRDAYDEVEILPSWRGQYKRKD